MSFPSEPEEFGKDREIALVFFHHRCQNRLRKVQEALFEGADNGLRRFHQICDLIQKLLIRGPFVCAGRQGVGATCFDASGAGGNVLYGRRDQVAAVCSAQADALRGRVVEVAVCVRNV